MKVVDSVRNRRSTVAFSTKQVEKEAIESIFEAARWAPSSLNEQPWKFIYAEQGSVVYEKILQSLAGGNQVWAQNAPLLIVTLASKYLSRSGEKNKYAWYDLGQSVANLSVQATAIGLKLHQMGGFNPFKLKEWFNISDDYEPVSVIAAGYPGEVENLDPKLLKREQSQRSRKSLDEIVFNASYQKEPISIN